MGESIRRLRYRLKGRAVSAWYGWFPPRSPQGVEVRPFIITGLPRSGTSLMSSLMTRRANFLAINEPKELNPFRLEVGDATRQLRAFLLSVARQAADRGTMRNRVDPNQPDRLTTDTWNERWVTRDVPIEIDRDQPLGVGVKMPMPFMDHLDEFLTNWEDLRAVIMLRDPVPTIRSWKNSFGWQPGLDDPAKGPRFTLHQRVPPDTSPLERRAWMWRIVVEEAMDQQEKHPGRVQLVRYEDLLSDPCPTMEKIFGLFDAGGGDESVDVSDVAPRKRDQYEGFTEDELKSIRSICAPAQEALLARTGSLESCAL